MGLFIYSTKLAEELLGLMDFVKIDGSYQLRFASDGSGRIEWAAKNGSSDERVLSSEPEATPWRQLLLNLLTPFAPEDWL